MKPAPTKADEFVDALSDAEFAELVREVLGRNKRLTEDGRGVWLRLEKPRESRFLRREVYEAFGRPSPPNLLPEFDVTL